VKTTDGHFQWWSAEDSGEWDSDENGYVGEVEAFLKKVETEDRSDIYSDYADAFRT
jgi:hypothetical protein